MKTTTGTCRFCGQIMSVEVPDDYTEADCNEAATQKCECDAAREYVMIEDNVTYATASINRMFANKGELSGIRNALLNAVRPMATGYVDKLSVVYDEYRATMEPSGTGIKVELTQTLKERVISSRM